MPVVLVVLEIAGLGGVKMLLPGGAKTPRHTEGQKHPTSNKKEQMKQKHNVPPYGTGQRGGVFSLRYADATKGCSTTKKNFELIQQSPK